MNRKALRIAALLSAAAMLITGCSSSSSSDENALPKVSVNELEKKDLSEKLTIEGTVESAELDSTITTDLTTCKVSSVKVSVGDKVSAGDILFELDSTEIQNDIADLEKSIADSDTLYDYRYNQLIKNLDSVKKTNDLNIKEAQKNVENLRNSYNTQKSEYDNQLNSYNNLKAEAEDARNRAGSASDENEAAALMAEYQSKMSEAAQAYSASETAYAQMLSISSSIPLAEKTLESVKISASDKESEAQYEIDTYSLTSSSSTDAVKELEELKRKLDKTTIKATRDGVVSSVSAEEGKTCSNGILMTLQNASDMCIHISIPEEDFLTVESGMKAVITIPARKDDEYTGIVDRVLEIKNTNGFDAYVNIDDTTNFRIGMTAKVNIITVDAADVLAVTNKSVFEDEETGRKYVYEAEKQSDDSYKLRKVEVTEGITGDTYTEISGEGLDEGDYIVSKPDKSEENDIVDVRVGR